MPALRLLKNGSENRTKSNTSAGTHKINTLKMGLVFDKKRVDFMYGRDKIFINNYMLYMDTCCDGTKMYLIAREGSQGI